MVIEPFFDADTATFTYIVSDNESKHCAVIDPVLNFDIHSGRITTDSIEQLIEYINHHQLKLEWILETHAHADHLSGAKELKEKIGGKIGIGENIIAVQEYWVPLFNEFRQTPMDGSQFDKLFKEGETFHIGQIEVNVLHTPGHTPACLSYAIEDALFVGDTIFMPYVGTARTDFPGGSAETLYDSIQKLLKYPNHTRIFVGHDYPEKGKDPQCQTTVQEQKNHNQMVKQGISKETFVQNRNNKDKGKPVPKLLYPAIQVNMRCGNFEPMGEKGYQYIKIPLTFISSDKAGL